MDKDTEGGAVQFGELPDFLNTKQAAGFLGVTQYTVTVMCNEGALPCCKIGNRWRIPKQQLWDHMQELLKKEA